MSHKPCSVCRHAQRPEIDLALVGGEATRSIAKRINAKAPAAKPLSHDAILRHKKHVGAAISKALARRGEDPPADALADKVKTTAADVERLEESLLVKIERLEADARRIGDRAESEGDLRAALVANKGLMDVIRLLHDLTPAPKTNAADTRRVLEWQAEELGISVDELAAECERIAALQADLAAGRMPAHTVRPPPPPAYVAPPPPVVTPSFVAPPGVPPSLPGMDDADEVPAGLVLGRRPWAIVV